MPRDSEQIQDIGALVGGFLVLHLLAKVFDISSVWGVNFLSFYPDWVTLLFVPVALVLFHPAAQRGIHAWFGRNTTALDFWLPGRDGLLRRLLLVIALLCGFIFLRSATHLLGDGYLYLRELPLGESSVEVRMGHEPAIMRLASLIYHVCNRFGWPAGSAYRVLSVLAGLLHTTIAFHVASTIGHNRRERLFTLALLLTPGCVQFFFGYVETYPLIMPTTLLYLWLCLRALDSDHSPWLAAVVLGLGITLHFTMLSLFPSFLILLLLRGQRNGRYKNARGWLSIGMIPLSTLVMLMVLGFDSESYLEGLRSNHLLPVTAFPDFYQPYRLLSWPHIIDALNQLLLVSPVMILALPALVKRPKVSTARFFYLAGAAAPALLFTWLVNPEIGAFRDWDLLAIPALPLTLSAAISIVDTIKDRSTFARTAMMICGALGIHAALWIGLNAREGAAVERFTACLERTALSQHARAYGWETLGSYYDRIKSDPKQASAAFDRAIEADNDNPRYWNLAAIQHAAQGDYDKAITFLERAVDMQTDVDPRHLNNLAVFHTEIGDHEAAIQYLEQVVLLQPNRAEGLHNLGLALARAGRMTDAATEFRGASEIRPRDMAILRDLGMALVQLGRFSEAERIMERMQEIAGNQAR